MKCELRVYVPGGYSVPEGFTLVPATDDFPQREYRGTIHADYRAINTLALGLNVKERAGYEASDMNSQNVGRVYYAHPLQMVAS